MALWYSLFSELIVFAVVLLVMFVERRELLKKHSEKLERKKMVQYVMPLIFVSQLFIANYFSVYEEMRGTFVGLGIAALVLVRQLYFDYMEMIKNKTRVSYHFCIAAVLSIIAAFSVVYAAIESVVPNSFSNITTGNWIARSIDFLYFSIVTFTTVGFGDIAPQTSVARFLVSAEILIAFVMIVLVVNLVASKEESLKKN